MANRVIRSIITSSLLGVLLVAPPAFAQSQDQGWEGVLEEVIVTATKREKNIQDVPIAISALTARDIENAGFKRVEEMTTQVPNFTYAQTTTKKITALVIRGLSTSGGIGNDPNIGVYIDGVYIGRDSGFNANLSDIERVEVLKGPQGTLFGRNSTTGALNITTRKPSDETSFEIEGSVGDLDYTRFGATVNGGISDSVFGKVTVVKTDRDGYLDNTFGGTANDTDNLFARGQLLFTPSDKLDITISADYNDDKGNGNNYVAGQGPDQFAGEPVNFDRVVNIPDLGFEDRKIKGASATVEYAMDNGYELTSITGWRSIDEHSLVDGDYSPLELAEFEDIRDQSQFSQELRIASPPGETFEWVAGVYYFDQDFDAVQDVVNGRDTVFAFGGAFVDPFFFSLIGTGQNPTDFGLPLDSTFIVSDAGIDTESIAAFVSGTYRFSEQWSVTGGLRYTDDQKDFTFTQISDPLSQQFGFGVIDCADPAFGCGTERDDSELTPLLGVEFRPNDDIMAYLKYSEGFNAGGFNANINSGTTPLSFGPETVEAYELGFKSQLADNRVRLNAAVFSMDYKDKQESFFLAEAGGFVQTNAGAAKSQGGEIEFTALPFEGLEVFGSVGYVDAEYTDFGDNTDNQLANAPEWQWNVGGQYTWPVFDNLEMSARADVFYQDDRFLGANNDPGFIFTDTTLVNVRVGLASQAGRWSATAWVRNLTDDDSIAQIFGGSSFFIPSYNYAPNIPRTYGLDFRFSF